MSPFDYSVRLNSASFGCMTTKIQAFNDILDAAVLSVTVCGEDVEGLGEISLPWQ